MSTRRIPLRDNRGDVCAFTIVDESDFEMLSARRWHMAGGPTGRGYATTSVKVGPGKPISCRMHRLLLGLLWDDPRQGDHRNGNRLDNRRMNLRIVPGKAENAQNRRSPVGAFVPFRGVTFNEKTGRWRARVGQIHIGYFDTPEEASVAASVARTALLPWSIEETG